MIKEILEKAGWQCARCSCPGAVGWDCVNAKFRGVIIQQRGLGFRIVRNSLVIESAHVYQLEAKLNMYGLNAAT